MASELTSTFMGMELGSPVIVGSCPLTLEPETVRQLIDAGAGAIVLPSLLQEQIVHASAKFTDSSAATQQSGYQPQQDKYNGGVENYLATIQYLKSTHHVPIIASMNGASSGEWVDFAIKIAASGADALELNLRPIVADPSESAEHVEYQLCKTVRRVSENLTIPVSVKLSQRFTNLASIAHKLHDAGAEGLTLFSHLPHWDVSIDRMHWTIRWELSPINSLGGILEGIVRVRTGGLDTSIAASGGVRTSEDAIKTMIAGADVVMVTSEIYRSGPDAVRKILEGIHRYLDASPYDSLLAFQQARSDVELRPERLQYVDPLTQPDRYIDPTPIAASATGDSFGHPL